MTYLPPGNNPPWPPPPGPPQFGPQPRRNPPSKYLALWIALPLIAAFMVCGAVGSMLDDDEPDDAKPQPVASIATTATATTPAPAPTPSSTPTASSTPTSVPPTSTRTTTTRTTTRPPNGGGGTTTPPASVYYKNCTEVKAAGAAPLYSYQPGYRPALDSDRDGVACES